MSALAKVFVIFNLVLAVAFFGTSASLFYMRHNWHEAYNDLKRVTAEEYRKIQERFEKQKAQIDLLGRDNAQFKTENANHVARNRQQVTEIEDLKTQIGSKEKDLAQALRTNEETQKTLQEKEASIVRLTQSLETANRERDAAVERQKTAVEDLTRVKIDWDKTNDQLSQTLIAQNDLQNKLETNLIIFENLAKAGINVEDYNTPPINGIVEAVHAQDKLVVLSVGKDQNVMPGYNFYVRRGSEYIGKVKVIQVFEDLSGARVEFAMDNQSIQVGDLVTTWNTIK